MFARHAGPGDSFLIAYGVLVLLHRRRVWCSRTRFNSTPASTWSWAGFRIASSLPTPKAGEDIIEAIGQLAEGMDERDALIIFPEGGNFTERRRLHAIERLRTQGSSRRGRQGDAHAKRAASAAGWRAGSDCRPRR